MQVRNGRIHDWKHTALGWLLKIEKESSEVDVFIMIWLFLLLHKKVEEVEKVGNCKEISNDVCPLSTAIHNSFCCIHYTS
jgi:hypothetical protein